MSEFVPFSIEQQHYQQIMQYLGEVPAKFANPLISFFAERAKEAALENGAAEHSGKKPATAPI